MAPQSTTPAATSAKSRSETAHVEGEKSASLHAGESINRIYNALLDRYPQPITGSALQQLTRLCVRLVFCLYAEAAGLFAKGLFLNYLRSSSQPGDKRMRLLTLFRALNVPPAQRDPSDPALLTFPHVYGGLFDGIRDDSIPPFDPALCSLIEDEAAADFNRATISTTILGGLFESTINPNTRRAGGMHYTSAENIHKVIDPLFLDALRAELAAVLSSTPQSGAVRARKLKDFLKKLASLTFLDPACGSGNFLTETFISLRRLENEALRHLASGRGELALGAGVSINQFHGIEINDFAAAIAKTTLWIASVQMWRETREFTTEELSDFPPSECHANIRVADALAVDWLENVPGRHIDYIISNPPFVGARLMGKEQKAGLLRVCRGISGAGDLDYVSGWFLRAAQLMQADPTTRAALVATNSVVQGQSVTLLWRPLMEQCGVFIDFAHRTFKWTNATSDQAAVHCVIVGMTAQKPDKCTIFDEQGRTHSVTQINAYLTDAPRVFLEKRTHPLCVAPKMVYGNIPLDGGYLLFTPEERDDFLTIEPSAAKYFKRFMGAEELIQGRVRYCLWLVDACPQEMADMPKVSERVRRVREFRLKSPRKETREDAERAWLFSEIRQPNIPYLAIPMVSSEKREYLPMAFCGKEIISSAAIHTIPGASLYHFGVLSSAMHAAWLRTVAGRLEMRYRYSAGVVYNNFPWPSPTVVQRMQIESCARGVLVTREQFPDKSLAALYDPLLMPPELRRAHEELDTAVDAAYGHTLTDDAARVSLLFTLYQNLVLPAPSETHSI